MQYVGRRSAGSPGTREFFVAMTLVLLAALLFGFARTFFLKPWCPEAQALAAPETYFLYHGIAFAAWFALLRVPLAGAGAWQGFARWAVGLV